VSGATLAWWPAVTAAATALLWPGASRPQHSLARTSRGARRGLRRAQAGWVRRWRWRGQPRTGGPVASDLADAIVLVALALRSGLGLAEALREVALCSERPLRDDLAAVVAALRWGRSSAEAWAFAGPAWRPVARVMQLAEETGAAPADVVADTAARLRELHERDLEGRAARAGVLLVLPLGLAFLPAFGCTAVVPVVIALARGLLSG
jgi:Type II secretion system (T2SS), protein F